MSQAEYRIDEAAVATLDPQQLWAMLKETAAGQAVAFRNMSRADFVTALGATADVGDSNAKGAIHLDTSGLDLGIRNIANNSWTTLFTFLSGMDGVAQKVTALTSSATETNVSSQRRATNEGATALVVRTLPTAAAGQVFSFTVQDADGIKIVAGSGDTIRLDTNRVSASAGYIQSLTIGSSVTLISINATEWMAVGIVGSWGVDGGTESYGKPIFDTMTLIGATSSGNAAKFGSDILFYRESAGKFSILSDSNPGHGFEGKLSIDLGNDWQYGVTLAITGTDGNALRLQSNFLLSDDKRLAFGDGTNSGLAWSTSGSGRVLAFETIVNSSGNGRGYFVFSKMDDRYSFSSSHFSLTPNPTVRILSGAGASSTLWLQLYHDQTDGIIQSGAGKIKFLDSAGADKFSINSTGIGFFATTPAARQTYGAPTGTATRTTFATTSVTLEQLAERVKAMVDDLRSFGLFA